MPTRVTTITEEAEDPATVQPINVSLSTPDDREVQMQLAPGARPRVQIKQPEPPSRGAAQPPSAWGEFIALSSMMQSWQNTQQQQSLMLRDLDSRLARMEDRLQPVAVVPPVETATWWVLWGMLMVIFGAALVVVVLMVITRI